MEKSFIPSLIQDSKHEIYYKLATIFFGVLGLSVLAQVAIPLPFSPVPITGQTFGVTLMALLFGRKLSVYTICAYLFLGGFGLPIFAMGRFGLSFGPTTGYLVGMFFSAIWVGYLADKGFSKKLHLAFLAGLSGSILVFTFGIIGLAYFIPSANLMTIGLIPFLPGDLIKTTFAATIASALYSKIKS
jgi:biotin transport system substrate-specific component